MNIAYLVVREEIFSPIIKTQIIDNIKELSINNKVYLIWLCRVDYYIKKRKEYINVVEDLKEFNIELIRIPIVVGKFPLNEWQINFVKNQSIYKIEKEVEKNKIEVINARGYNAGFVLANLKIRNKVEVKSVFDPRSPYLTEIQSTYKVSKTSKKYSFWENSEQLIIQQSDMTIATSEPFKHYLNKHSDNVVIIPNNATMPDYNDMFLRNKEQKRFTICYVGSIGYGWNNAVLYAKFTKSILEKYPEISFEYYVMPSGIEILKKELINENVDLTRVFIGTESPINISKKIAGCIAGMQIMEMPDERLGIKTVDYLSAGIPIICNTNAMGCAEVVEKFNVGINMDEASLEDFIKKQIETPIYDKCLEVAHNFYSTKAVSKMYEKYYLSLKTDSQIKNISNKLLV